ncbi:MAG: type II toxin-antitoxin system VapC family toxin [Terriglobia bacterium]
MIVADTNLIAYLLIKGQFTERAVMVYTQDPNWVAPRLWQSEFRNVLGVHLRRGLLDLNEALDIMEQAEQLIKGQEFETVSPRVLRLAVASGCSTYDCEFVALAQELAVPLVTSDAALLEKFNLIAVSMDDFCS